VFFQRELPRFLDQEWGVRKTGQTRYRRVNADPVLYDVTVDNGTALHRTQFDFGNVVSSTTAAASGPVSVNITNDANRQNALALSAGVGYGATINATNPLYYNGAVGSHNTLTTATASTTVVMKRPDGKFIVIAGNATANAQVYDETLQTFTANTTNPTAPLGRGGFAVKRPDGKFLLVLGNATTITNIYDPVANTFTVGPALTAAAGLGASVIPLPNGRMLIMSGNFTNTSQIYDPVQNTMTAGPTPSTVVGGGSMWIPRPNGTFLFIPGMITEACTALPTVTNNFDPYSLTFTSAGSPAITGVGPGAFAFQRNDGEWIIVRGGSTATSCIGSTATHIYNPVSNQILATGPALTAAAGLGAHAIPRPDGTWLIVLGGGGALYAAQTATNIYIEQAGAVTALGDQTTIGSFIAGPSLITGSNSGAVSFQRTDGKFVTITGAATTTTATNVQLYDAGWVASGIYKSEQFDLSPVGTKLDSNSTLVWKGNMFSTVAGGISAEVRTAPTQAALSTSTTREVTVSGGLINPGTNDTWLQINFNFRRSFPSFGGIYTDTWNNNGGSAMNYPIRTIATPVLYEYKVTKDKDVINLQSDGLSVFRVSSSGDVFTQAGGTINTSGADLAERYSSQVALEDGEVVSIDPQNNHGVMRTTYQYQPDVLGVVSTDPGFVAGAYTENSYPIALIGRVPVKVSTENGIIRQGDYLTPSSVLGHAMKATLAGHVIGKALESMNESKLTDCPASSIASVGRKCGTIMMFVNLVDYLGSSIDDSIALKATAGLSYTGSVNTTTDGGTTAEAGVATSTVAVNDSVVTGRTREVLSYLEQVKADRNTSMASRSELFADRGSFVTEVVSPTIIARILKADAIEGLNISVKSVVADSLSLNAGNNGFFKLYGAPTIASVIMSDATSTDASSTPTTVTTSTPFLAVSFDALGNGFFAGSLAADIVKVRELTVLGSTTLAGLNVQTIGTASSTVDILADATFFGRPYFTKDTGGRALIRAGKTTVDVVFDREYIENPIVNATISLDEASTTDDSLEEAILAGDVRYLVTKKGVKGFTIRINKASANDISFDWLAIAVKGSKLFTSKVDAPVVPVTPIATSTAPVVTEPVDTNASTTPVISVPVVTVPVIETPATTTEPISTSTPEVSVTTETVAATSSEPILEVNTPVETPAVTETPVIVESVSSEPVNTPENI
jgi:hypothetical protein